jgi:hypothetical protein
MFFLIRPVHGNMDWPSLWEIPSYKVLGRDIETDELTQYDIVPVGFEIRGETHTLALLQELDKNHRVLCTNFMMTLVRTENGLYELFGGAYKLMSEGHIQTATDAWRLTDISCILDYTPYEDTGKYDYLNLDYPVIDEIPRWYPHTLLLEDGSVYNLGKGAIIGQVRLNRRSRKPPQ